VERAINTLAEFVGLWIRLYSCAFGAFQANRDPNGSKSALGTNLGTGCDPVFNASSQAALVKNAVLCSHKDGAVRSPSCVEHLVCAQ